MERCVLDVSRRPGHYRVRRAGWHRQRRVGSPGASADDDLCVSGGQAL